MSSLAGKLFNWGTDRLLATLDHVPRKRAAQVFGRRCDELAQADIQAFENYIMWQLAALSTKHELPFQIHTGDARIQGSNPILLVDFIEANPSTKFILFHGGYPWVGETGAIAMNDRQPRNRLPIRNWC